MASLTSPNASLLHGGARPRVHLAPAYSYSLGSFACELLQRAGKTLDPWQIDSCDLLMAVREDGRWACFEYAEWVARQNGKGVILEARALGGLLLFGEELILWSAHEYKTAIEAFRRVRTLLGRIGRIVGNNENLLDVDGILVKVNNTNGEESFERLDTGARLRFIARSKGSGRGFSAGVNIIDEAFAFTPAQLDALMPTMQAADNPQIIYTSTPPLDSVSGEQMFALRKRAEAGGDDSLGYRDWGVEGNLDDLQRAKDDLLRLDPDRPELWAATNPALGSRIRFESLERSRRSMGAYGFAREVLGVWPPPPVEGKGVFDMELWSARADPTSKPGEAIAIAIDAPPDRRSAAIASAGRREDGLLHTKITDHRPGMHWVVDRVLELVTRFTPLAVLIDPASPAGSLIADLAAAGVEVTAVTARELAQACGAYFDDVEHDRMRHCDQETLTAAVQQATKRSSGDAFAWDRKSTSGDISPLVASTLASYGFRAHAPAQSAYDTNDLMVV